jgi:hypothetical protein
MRDWITSVLQIETAVIGAIGAGFFLKNAPDICLDLLQKVLLMLAALAFSLSVGGAVTVLNMLPGAAQRDANSDWARERDVYSIFTNPRTRIKFYANFVARGFYIGIIFLLLFLFFRVFPDPWGSVCKMVAPHS